MPNPTRLERIRERCDKATPGPWVGCNHVKDHSFDAHCHCGQATVWSEPADTVICEKYENSDGSGPEPLNREAELNNMTFIAHAREDVPYLLKLAHSEDRLAEALEYAQECCVDSCSGKEPFCLMCKNSTKYHAEDCMMAKIDAALSDYQKKKGDA